MIQVNEAFNLLLTHPLNLKEVEVSIDEALGTVLNESVLADRPIPPFHRVTMDGIAIHYASFVQGIRLFPIEKIQAAGADPYILKDLGNAVEVMTGAILPENTNVVIRYEDLSIKDGVACVNIDKIKENQNIHFCGSDKEEGTILMKKGSKLGPIEISVAASVGKSVLNVLKFPKTLLISTGNELISVSAIPKVQEIRISNTYAIAGYLQELGIQADHVHLEDDEEVIRESMSEFLKKYDLIIFTGGVSAGKYDFIPKVCYDLGVLKHFHKVAQKPGKPLFFGTKGDVRVFGLPGNPVSTLLCVNRYILPWLRNSFGLKATPTIKVQLKESISFPQNLTFFVPVSVYFNQNEGIFEAQPFHGNGSGDFTNLLDADGFIELPAEQNECLKGNFATFWPFRSIV